jgi:hypothetical protein
MGAQLILPVKAPGSVLFNIVARNKVRVLKSKRKMFIGPVTTRDAFDKSFVYFEASVEGNTAKAAFVKWGEGIFRFEGPLRELEEIVVQENEKLTEVCIDAEDLIAFYQGFPANAVESLDEESQRFVKRFYALAKKEHYHPKITERTQRTPNGLGRRRIVTFQRGDKQVKLVISGVYVNDLLMSVPRFRLLIDGVQVFEGIIQASLAAPTPKRLFELV